MIHPEAHTPVAAVVREHRAQELALAEVLAEPAAAHDGPVGTSVLQGPLALRRQVAADGVRKEVLGKPAAPAAYALYRHVALFRILVVGSLAVELAAPAMLLSSRLSRLWALNAFAMHWGTWP
ncbi:MAG: hypothetical protein M3R46_08285 [Actinomycetota bacterium]|nr:hypothetical protein [Actinomycetota bacterium]